MVEAKNVESFVVPPTEQLGKAITDSIIKELAAESDKLRLKHMLDKITAEGIDTSTYNTEFNLTTKGPNGSGTHSLGTEDSTFTDNRKLALSLLSSLSLLYATSLKKVTVHLKPGPVSALFLRIYRLSVYRSLRRRKVN
jgi:hypothetical protein